MDNPGRLLAAIGILLCTGCSGLLYYPERQLLTDPSRFKHKPESIEFKSEDGVKLHGWYFRSPRRPAKTTLLFFHGNAQNLSTHFFALYWMLEEGFDFFIFDYRGYGLSEGKPSPEGTVSDGKAALRWLSEHKDPKSEVAIFAQSLGGAIALRVACETAKTEGALFKVMIVDSSFTSYRKAAQKVLAKSWVTWPFQWLGWLLMNDAHAPKSCLSEIAPHPLLIVHGTDDQTIDFFLGEKLFSDAPEPKEFWRVEGGQHTDFLFRENFRYRKQMTDWLDRQLPKN